MNISDLKTISELLSANSDSGNKRKRGSDDEIRNCPLHRADPIYTAKDIKEQIDLITEKAKKHVVSTSTSKKKQSTPNGTSGRSSSNDTDVLNGHGDDDSSEDVKSQSSKKRKTKKEVTPKVDTRPAKRNKSKNLQVSDDEDDEVEDEFVPEKKSVKRGRRG